MDERAAEPIPAQDREARLFQEVKRIPIPLEGAPITVRFLPGLTASRGKLLSGQGIGQPVLAGSFPRRRLIVLDKALENDSTERARILVHEVFHFVWPRLGNPLRASWSEILEAERRGRARGELGWSSEWRKRQSAPWRDYICESFCDTAAWLYSGIPAHDEFTLAGGWRAKRRRWFEREMGTRHVLKI